MHAQIIFFDFRPTVNFARMAFLYMCAEFSAIESGIPNFICNMLRNKRADRSVLFLEATVLLVFSMFETIKFIFGSSGKRFSHAISI